MSVPGPGDGARQQAVGNQIVHVRGDSDSDLQALFDVLIKKDQHVSYKPMKARNFPETFFKPPEPRSVHSREGSQDSAAGGFANTSQLGALPIVHSRSMSSPAMPSRTHITPSHTKQPSADFIDDLHNTGWDVKPQLGQSYFSNTNTWQQQQQQQVKSQSNQSLNNGAGPQQGTPTLSPSQSLQDSPAVSAQDLTAMPPGWEQGRTAEGEVYFINHMDKTTSWFDPRIPKHQQRPCPAKAMIAPPQQTLPSSSPHPQPNTPINVPPAGPPRRVLPNEQFIQTELQKITREKERLQREQEDIRLKEMMLNKLMAQQSLMDTKPGFPPQVPPSGPMAITKVGVDPFLGHSGNPNLDSHARQSSADSGLGGMGTGYSLPRTPEDLLSNVDEMDTTPSDPGQSKVPKQLVASSDFNMNELQGGGGVMEVAGGLDGAGDTVSGMESDDLVQSLHEEIGNELLSINDIDVTKMDNLLWL